MGEHPNLDRADKSWPAPLALRDSRRRRPSCDVLWTPSAERGQSGIGSLPAPGVVQAVSQIAMRLNRNIETFAQNAKTCPVRRWLVTSACELGEGDVRRARLIQATRMGNKMPRNYITWMREEWDGDLGGFRYRHERDAFYLGKGDGPFWRLVRSRKPFAIPRSRLKHDGTPASVVPMSGPSINSSLSRLIAEIYAEK
jgi:hypothetical protein